MENILSGQTTDTMAVCTGGHPSSFTLQLQNSFFFFLSFKKKKKKVLHVDVKKKKKKEKEVVKCGSSGGIWTFFSMAHSSA